jgi:hypothetical protein
MSVYTREEWQSLMDFFGPEDLAALTKPPTDEQYAMLDRFLAEHPPVQVRAEVPLVVTLACELVGRMSGGVR